MKKQETLEEDKNRNIIHFLCGSHSYDGVWFGDKHPYKEGIFWWRSILQEQDKQKDDYAIEFSKFIDKNYYQHIYNNNEYAKSQNDFNNGLTYNIKQLLEIFKKEKGL